MKFKHFFIMALMSMSLGAANAAPKTAIEHVHPLFWYSDMKNPEFQLLLHGNRLGEMEPELRGAENVEIKEVVRVYNANYLINIY